MKIIIDDRISKKGYAVKLQADQFGQRVLLNTGVFAQSADDFADGEFKKSDVNHMYKNKRLDYIKSEVERIIMSGDVKDFKARCKAVIKGGKPEEYAEKERTFLKVMDEYIGRKSKASTRTCYEQSRKKIEAYDRNVTFSKMTSEWLFGFDEHLSRTMSVNGKSIVLRNIRAVWNYALDMDLTTAKYPFRRTSGSARFGIKYEQTRKRNVPVELLRKLKDCDVESWQEPYRDMFMLMVYLVGIDIVDILHLRKSDLKEDGYIYYVRAKTDKENAMERRVIAVKVEPEAMEIIERLGGRDWLLYPMDRYADHHDYARRMNRALKTIGMDCGRGKRCTGTPLVDGLTTKWSRHTWATLAADLDFGEDLIGRALGHSQSSSRNVTKTYINYDQRKIDAANRRVIDYINEVDNEEKCVVVSLFSNK